MVLMTDVRGRRVEVEVRSWVHGAAAERNAKNRDTMADGKLDSTLASSHDIYAPPWLLVQIYSAYVQSRVPWQHSVAGLSTKAATSIAFMARFS